MWFIVAELRYENSKHGFRLFNTDTKEVKDLSNTELTSLMLQGFAVANMVLRHEISSPYRIFSDYKRCGCDDTVLSLIDSKNKPLINPHTVMVTAIDGEFVELVNCEGKSCKVHMLQVANNVRNNKIVLANARIREDGWILPGKWE